MSIQKIAICIATVLALTAAVACYFFVLPDHLDTSIAAPNRFLVWDKLPSNGSAADAAMTELYAAKDIKTQNEAIERVQKMADGGDARAAFRLARFLQKECARRDYKRALALYQQAASDGDAWATNNLGLMYFEGQGVTKNPAAATAYFAKASEQGSTYGDQNLGLAYLNGSGVEPDPAKGLALLQKGVDQNQPSSMATLAYIYTWGAPGVKKDLRQAFNLYSRGAALGDRESELGVDEAYISGDGVAGDWNRGLKGLQAQSDAGNPKATNFMAYLYCCGYYGFTRDPSRGLALHELAATQGSQDSAVKAGWMVASGDGTLKNAKLGLSILERSSDQGNAGAANKMGELYHEDDDIKRDDVMAIKYWSRAAELGSCKAMGHLADAYSHQWSVAKDEARSTQYTMDAVQCESPPQGFYTWRLGTRYRDGLGIAKNCGKALYWFKISAQSGEINGMNDLGFLYEKGCDAAPDLVTAFHWYLRAAKSGNAVAQNNVGAMLKHGKGVERTDLIKAYAWLTVAKLNGSKQAADNLTEFAHLFSEADRLHGLAYVPVVESMILNDSEGEDPDTLDGSY